MSKQLQRKVIDTQNVDSHTQMQMRQDALRLQGVSSRLQIKQERKMQAKQPVQVEPSHGKRLVKSMNNPDLISASAGYGRMSKERMNAIKMQDYGSKAEKKFGSIVKKAEQDDFLTFS